jgi:tetratricopeptide (TPR) repeat protein
MKSTIIVMFLSTLVSCSSSRIERKINDKNWDALANETYLRWGDERLQGTTEEVVKCYQGKSSDALDSFRKNYLLKSENPHYWLYIGNCLFIEKEWTKAEFFYHLALESGHSTVKSIAMNNLGLLSFKFEQWDKGREYLEKSLALKPSFKVPRYNLSQLFLQFGYFDKAIEVLEHESIRGHKDVDLYFSLANAYLFKGNLEASEKYFRLIPAEFHCREDIAATLALFQIKKGELENAKKTISSRDRSQVKELSMVSQRIEKLLLQRMKED